MIFQIVAILRLVFLSFMSSPIGTIFILRSDNWFYSDGKNRTPHYQMKIPINRQSSVQSLIIVILSTWWGGGGNTQRYNNVLQQRRKTEDRRHTHLITLSRCLYAMSRWRCVFAPCAGDRSCGTLKKKESSTNILAHARVSQTL